MEKNKKILIIATGLLTAGVAMSVAGLLAVIEAEDNLTHPFPGIDIYYWQEVEDLGHKVFIIGLPFTLVGLVALLFGAFAPKTRSYETLSADPETNSKEGLPPYSPKSVAALQARDWRRTGRGGGT